MEGFGQGLVFKSTHVFIYYSFSLVGLKGGLIMLVFCLLFFFLPLSSLNMDLKSPGNLVDTLFFDTENIMFIRTNGVCLAIHALN